MEAYFIEDPQKIILRALPSFEQRHSGCKRISLLRRMLLPNPSCRLLRRSRSHYPHVTGGREIVKPRRELVGDYDRDLAS